MLEALGWLVGVIVLFLIGSLIGQCVALGEHGPRDRRRP